MVSRDEITQATHQIIGQDLLEKSWVKDEVANGVQIEGALEVSKVALGVSLNQTFLKAAIKWGAQYCIFHHGLDTQTHLSRIPKYLQGHLQLIFTHQLTIAGYHYTLDAHPEIGNNAQIIKLLGAKLKEPLYEDWGYVGEFDQTQEMDNLIERCHKLFNHEVLSFRSNNNPIKTIGVVSGAGKPQAKHVEEIISKHIDLYISGETSEYIPHRLIESGISYFICGHYATETFGIKALGEKLKEHFKNQLEIKFIDIPTVIWN